MNHLVVATAALFAVIVAPYIGYGVLYALVRPRGSPAEKRAAEPTVSVVLPAYNEERIVESKLENLLNLDYPMGRLEVVVADSSDDRTAEIVEEFFEGRDSPTLTLVREEERLGVATAINRAVEHAANEVVFRTDCDSLLDEGALREAAANLTDPEVGAVTGRQTEVLGESQVETEYRNLLSRIQALESHLDSTFIFHGPCFAFRRADYVPIDVDSLADDTEIAVRIRRAGKLVLMDPAMQFVESGVSDFRKRRRRKDRRAMGLLQLLVRNRDILGRHGRYGRVVLPFNWWFMVASPWLLSAFVILATAAAVSTVGWAGAAVPLALVGFGLLGTRDALGPAQPLWSVIDAQVSLLIAAVRLLGSRGDGTWEIDRESREVFE